MDTRLKIRQINSNINNLKKSVADGKSAIASAITSKGVSTAADASHATMATNIRAITTVRKPIFIRFGLGDKSLSFSQGVTVGKHYLIVLIAANKYSMAGWANGNWNGSGGNFDEIYRGQQTPMSVLAIYVTATSGTISFSKDYGNDDWHKQAVIMLQLD